MQQQNKNARPPLERVQKGIEDIKLRTRGIEVQNHVLLEVKIQGIRFVFAESINQDVRHKNRKVKQKIRYG